MPVQSLASELVPHDPAWARRYARERDRLACVLGDRARRLEHVGPTAVPGLSAEPVVDVLLSVTDADDDTDWLPALEGAGYALSAHGSGYRLLRTADGAVRVHVWTAGSDGERRLMLAR